MVPKFADAAWDRPPPGVRSRPSGTTLKALRRPSWQPRSDPEARSPSPEQRHARAPARLE